MLQRVHIKMWRMAKGVLYGTLLWFDEQKELPELYKLSDPNPGSLIPVDSGPSVCEVDIPLSVSDSQRMLDL